MSNADTDGTTEHIITIELNCSNDGLATLDPEEIIIAELRQPIAHIIISPGELDCDLLSIETLVALLYEDWYDGGGQNTAEDAWQTTLDHIDEMIYSGSTYMPDDDDWISSFWAVRRDELVAWRSTHS